MQRPSLPSPECACGYPTCLTNPYQPVFSEPCRCRMNFPCRIRSLPPAPSTSALSGIPGLGEVSYPWASDTLSAFQSAHCTLCSPSLVPLRTGIFPQSPGSAPGAVPCPSDEPRGSLCQLLDSSWASQQPGSFRKYQPSAQFVLNAENCLLQFPCRKCSHYAPRWIFLGPPRPPGFAFLKLIFPEGN